MKEKQVAVHQATKNSYFENKDKLTLNTQIEPTYPWYKSFPITNKKHKGLTELRIQTKHF